MSSQKVRYVFHTLAGGTAGFFAAFPLTALFFYWYYRDSVYTPGSGSEGEMSIILLICLTITSLCAFVGLVAGFLSARSSIHPGTLTGRAFLSCLLIFGGTLLAAYTMLPLLLGPIFDSLPLREGRGVILDILYLVLPSWATVVSYRALRQRINERLPNPLPQGEEEEEIFLPAPPIPSSQPAVTPSGWRRTQ